MGEPSSWETAILQPWSAESIARLRAIVADSRTKRLPSRLDRVQQRREHETIEWARRSKARLQRLLNRIASGRVGREAALGELEVLRRNSTWPPDDKAAEKVRILAPEKRQIEAYYQQFGKPVRRANAYFNEGVLPPSDDDLKLFRERTPELTAMAIELKFSWTPDLVLELVDTKPSTRVIARIAEAMDLSEQSVKNVLHRKKSRAPK